MINYFQKLFKGTKDEFLALIKKDLENENKRFIVTANPEAFMLGEKNPDINELLSDENTTIVADGVATIEALPIAEGEKEFYLIEWERNGQSFKNHFFTNIIDIDYQQYMDALRVCGMDEFEGF